MNDYIIQWKSNITGKTGRSEKPMSYSSAKLLVISLDKKYPEISHKVTLKGI